MSKMLQLLVLCLLFVSFAGAQSGSPDALPHCQILDGSTEPVYRVSLAVLPKEQLEGWGRTAFLELNADWQLAYFHDILWGDIDVNPRLRTIVMMESAGIQLPNQVVELSFDTGWTLRTMGGTAVQVRTRPGIYSDIEELGMDMLYMPFSLAVIQSFNDQLSGLAGFEVRPEFDREFVPLALLAWQPDDALRLEAGIPTSRAEWFVNRSWSLHAGLSWLNTTYDLREEGGLNRRQITLEDYRIYTGFSMAVAGDVRFVCDVGYLFDRNVSFKREADPYPRDVDIDDGPFIRMAMVGPF